MKCLKNVVFLRNKNKPFYRFKFFISLQYNIHSHMSSTLNVVMTWTIDVNCVLESDWMTKLIIILLNISLCMCRRLLKNRIQLFWRSSSKLGILTSVHIWLIIQRVKRTWHQTFLKTSVQAIFEINFKHDILISKIYLYLF